MNHSDIKNVWIDSDLSVGMKRYGRPGYSDVDDGYAILQLMQSEAVKIHGISAVFGNTRIDDAFRLCQHMADKYTYYEIPVYKGAGHAIDLNKVSTNEAVEAMANSLKEQSLTIMAIGPATNVGILLLKYPELAKNIDEVVLVAGRRSEDAYFAIGNQGRRARDLNFDLDNDAFRLLFQNQVAVTLCPFEISHKVWLNEHDLKTLSQKSEGAQWLAHHSKVWLDQWKEQGASGFNPFDVLASHYIIKPHDIIYEKLNARLEIYPDDTVGENQREVVKNYLICDDNEKGYPIRYCYDVIIDYHDRLIATFS